MTSVTATSDRRHIGHSSDVLIGRWVTVAPIGVAIEKKCKVILSVSYVILIGLNVSQCSVLWACLVRSFSVAYEDKMGKYVKIVFCLLFLKHQYQLYIVLQIDFEVSDITLRMKLVARGCKQAFITWCQRGN